MSWTGEIIGHRGAAGLAPENTLASFETALDVGVDRIELDVQRTLDRAAVVFHDLDLQRLAPGEAADLPVSRRELEDLRALDVGAAAGRPGCLIPTLDEVFALVDGRVPLILDIKGAGADGLVALELAAAAVKSHRAGTDTIISSFQDAVVRAADRAAPGIARALIASERRAGDPVEAARSLGCAALHAKRTLVDETLIRRCREAGLTLRAWTVNDEDELSKFMAMGVDGLVTDRPDVLRRVAGR